MKFQPPDTEEPGAPVFQREGDPPIPKGKRTDPPAGPPDRGPVIYDAAGRPPKTERVGEQVDVLV